MLLLEGLKTARTMSSPFLVTYHLARLGAFAARAGQHDKGMSWLQEALSTVDEVPDDDRRWFRGDIYGNLADLMVRQQQLTEARRYAEISIAQFEGSSNPDHACSSHTTLAEIHYECGEWVEASHGSVWC